MCPFLFKQAWSFDALMHGPRCLGANGLPVIFIHDHSEENTLAMARSKGLHVI